MTSTCPLGDIDIFLFNEGTHRQLHNALGAHTDETGTWFAVWAPDAATVDVVGDFSGWHQPIGLTPVGSSGIWAGHVDGAVAGQAYRYGVTSHAGQRRERSDPLAAAAHLPPSTASIIADLDLRLGGRGVDERAGAAHRPRRAGVDLRGAPRVVGAPRRTRQALADAIDELADPLADHALAHGFTHVELLPVMEHPFYGSWGYQTTGYFAPTVALRLADRPDGDGRPPPPAGHRRDPRLGPVALPDGRPRPRRVRRHPPLRARRPATGLPPGLDVGDLQLRAGARCARSWSRARSRWLERYHVDGLRVDAVASMLYLDYSRQPDEWIPNRLRRPREHRGDRLPPPAQHRRQRGVPRHGDLRRGVDGVAERDRRRRRGRPRVHVQVGHGVDARHPAVRAARSGAPPVPPRRDHVPFRVRVQRALRAAAVARRGRPRQGLAARQDARRRVATLRQPAAALRDDVGPAGQEAAVHGRRAGDAVGVGPRAQRSTGRCTTRRTTPACAAWWPTSTAPYRAEGALARGDTDHEGFAVVVGDDDDPQRVRLAAPRSRRRATPPCWWW